ncbi:MAG: electron transfer flavoprotein subunit alpha/FixB family protein, partial [Flavobacteriales bacterium]|nr:electron transfer flavoprotein subunit alpha/FixB family protein [Flavobacteriales bacterium]
MSTIVFIDTRGEKLPKAAQEAVTYASKLAGGPVTAVTFGTGSNLETLGAQGASKVIVARNVTAVDGQQLTKLVTDVAAKEGATTIVCVQDGTGKTVAPRIAAKLKAGHVAGAIAMPEGNTFKRNVFSGKAQAFLEVTSPVKVVSLMPNSIPIAKGEGTATVEEYSGDLGAARITVKEVRKAGVGIPLPEAEIVVSAGRGMKGPEHWGPIEELA